MPAAAECDILRNIIAIGDGEWAVESRRTQAEGVIEESGKEEGGRDEHKGSDLVRPGALGGGVVGVRRE